MAPKPYEATNALPFLSHASMHDVKVRTRKPSVTNLTDVYWLSSDWLTLAFKRDCDPDDAPLVIRTPFRLETRYPVSGSELIKGV